MEKVLLQIFNQSVSVGRLLKSVVHLSVGIDTVVSLNARSLYIWDNIFWGLSELSLVYRGGTVVIKISDIDAFLYGFFLLNKLEIAVIWNVVFFFDVVKGHEQAIIE